jgi:hypothetical protein
MLLAGYPVLFILKKHLDPEKRWKVYIDYRQLNDITIKNRYPLSLIKEFKDQLRRVHWFTAFNLPEAYGFIRITDGYEWKTAFRTQFGHFEYFIILFGFTNIPTTFQNMINYVLQRFLGVFVVVYLDDILIYSKSLEKHKQHVRQVL